MTATQLVTVVLFVLVLMVPGLIVGAAGGLRGWLLASAAPVLTFGVVGLASPLVPGLFARWSVWVLLGSAVVLGVVVFLVRLAAQRWFGRAQEPVELPGLPWRWQHHVGVAAAVLFAAGLGLLVMSKATESFTGVHQFWDAMIHSNATRYIADSGQSAPSALSALNAPGKKDFFYPNGYHVVGATVLQLHELPVNELVNIYGGLYAGFFALLIAGLVRVANGRPALAAASAVAAAAAAAMPYGLLFFGPLWPFGAGVVMVPGFLAVFVATVRSRRAELIVLTALAAIGMAALHPSAALATGVFCFFYLVFRWISLRRVPLNELRTLVLLGVLAGLYAIPQYLAATKAADVLNVSWPVIGTPGQTLGQLLFFNYVTEPQWLLVAAALVGLVGIRKLTGLRWLMGGGLFFAFLFVLAASYKGWLVSLLTNPWWNDAWRFAALVTIAQVVLIGHGIVVVRDTVAGWIGKLRPRLSSTTLARGGVLVAVGLVIALLGHGLYAKRNADAIKRAYSNGPTVTSEERVGMAELRTLVPPGATVMNDPVDGSPWMWALDGVRPLFGYPLVAPDEFPVIGPDRTMLYEKFDQLDTNAEVRALVRAANIQFVYVGSGFASPTVKRAPGLAALDGVRSLRLVYENADVRVYRVQL
ncbi:DUF6541 family protein [Actinocrispum sp. NPDC049592]|uniref:DUF6541 family protein n=1 Tax=Actinocrispum sp. NPDC049592 TaxID=3154835 RepID=UPI0034225B5D